ncbi:MAG: hypothetical protein ACLF0G_09430 [Candidatus Brocadiia bacterium]
MSRWSPGCLLLAIPLVACAGNAPREVDIAVHLGGRARHASPLLYGCSLPAPSAPAARALLPNLLRNGNFEQSPATEPLPMPGEWEAPGGWRLLSAGSKRIIVRDRPGAGEPLILAEGRRWREYRLVMMARKIDGPGGFGVLVEVADQGHYLRWTLGSHGNRFHVLERVGPEGSELLGPAVVGRIEPGRCYRVEVSLRRGVLRCSLDGRLIHRVGDAALKAAGVGLAAADARAEYFDVAVHGRYKKLLFEVNHPAEVTSPTLARHWEPLRAEGNDVLYGWLFLYPHGGNLCQRIDVRDYAGGDAGICQRGVPIAEGAAYQGHVYLRSAVEATVAVSLRGEEGQVYARAELRDLPPKWARYDFRLVPTASDAAARFCLSATGKAMVWVDGASLAPADALCPFGLRRGVVEALRRLRPAVLRWPAGGAERYDWRRGIGPPDLRPLTSVPHGGEDGFPLAPNDFGTDEFLALCEAAGAEPLVVLNPHLGLRPALYWLEYCNGEAGTPRGKLRAANGHREPYGVRFWALGETPWENGMKAERYAQLAADLADAMRRQYPGTRLIVPAGPSEWRAAVLDEASAAPHALAWEATVDEPAAFAARAAEWRRTADGHGLGLAVTDWRPAADPVPTAAVALNVLSRRGGPQAIATCPLVSPTQHAVEGRQLLDARRVGVQTTALYEAVKLVAAHPLRRLAETRLGGRGGPCPDLDVAAGWSGEAAVVRIVNLGTGPVRANVQLEGLGPRRPAGHAALHRLGPEQAEPSRQSVALEDGALAVRLGPRALVLAIVPTEGAGE